MDLPSTVSALRWFARDTFRQAAAARLSWLMLGASAVFIVVCLSVGVRGDVPLERDGEAVDFLPPTDPLADAARGTKGVSVLGGELTILFGWLRVPLGRDAREGVRFLELLLAGGVADALGVLLALVWTAGFLPTFLEPASASVLLAKPVPRWTLLAGKYLGVLAFVAAQAGLFVGGTWFALALRTGVWDPAYLLCLPLLVLHFAVFFGVSVLLAVRTRSTVVCLFGSLAFWFLCWGANYGRHVAVSAPEGEVAPATRALAETGYWVLPKPADLGMVLFDTLRAGNSFQRLAALQEVDRRGAYHPLLSLFTSLAFAAVVLAAAARRFSAAEY